MGLSRTFRLEVRRGAPVEKLISVLRQLATVESATPHYCCRTLGGEAREAAPTDLAQAWIPRDMVRAREALAYETGDRSVITAIVDTGVSREPPRDQRALSRRLQHSAINAERFWSWRRTPGQNRQSRYTPRR